MIALDLSLAWNRKNAPVTSQLHSQLLVDVMRQRAWKLFNDHREDIYEWVADQGVLAVVAFDFATRVVPEQKSAAHEGLMTWFETTHEHEQAVRQFRAFNEGLLARCAEHDRLTRRRRSGLVPRFQGCHRSERPFKYTPSPAQLQSSGISRRRLLSLPCRSDRGRSSPHCA